MLLGVLVIVGGFGAIYVAFARIEVSGKATASVVTVLGTGAQRPAA